MIADHGAEVLERNQRGGGWGDGRAGGADVWIVKNEGIDGQLGIRGLNASFTTNKKNARSICKEVRGDCCENAM